MGLYDFFSQEELDDLPHDDGPRAFSAFVRQAQRKLTDWTRSLDPNDETGWRALEDTRHSFVNIVIAAAKRYEIEPFSSYEVPRLRV